MENFKYLRVFKMAGIAPDDGDMICSRLNESTLDRLTRVGFDMRAIKPVIREATTMYGEITDESVNAILDNQNLMLSIISSCCQ